MEKYQLLNQVGVGGFGQVWKALNKQSEEVVAIKKLMNKKFHSREECLSLEEFKCLKILKHPNIVSLKEVIRERDNSLYLVFEFMERDLLKLMESRTCAFSESEVRYWCFQVFQGLHYMHEKGYFHRDLKPENLLICKDLIKIGDMGSAREINSSQPCTDYATTRWYRAPEVILRSENYSYKVDMWAMGAIMAELYMFEPLFPGTDVSDQLFKICGVLGSPNWHTWHEGLVLARGLNYKFPRFPGIDLSLLMPFASYNAISLIKSLCSWDPSKRPSASEALTHPFFHSCYNVPQSLPLSLNTTAREEFEQNKVHGVTGLSHRALPWSV